MLSAFIEPWVETRLLPTLTRAYPCRFTFYVADPVNSIQGPQATCPPLQRAQSCIITSSAEATARQERLMMDVNQRGPQSSAFAEPTARRIDNCYNKSQAI